MAKKSKGVRDMGTSQHQRAAADAERVRLKSLKTGKPLEHGGPVAEAVRRALVEHEKDEEITYETIAREVREQIDGAQTTARSVASIVRGLRRDGYRVPDRRHGRN